MTAPWLSDQTRLLALVTGEAYAAWIKRQFARWPDRVWREEYAVPLEDRPNAKQERKRA